MSHQNKWTERDIPDLHGRAAIVTGSNSGIGYATARALAHKGASVVMACRNPDRAEAAASVASDLMAQNAVPLLRRLVLCGGNEPLVAG